MNCACYGDKSQLEEDALFEATLKRLVSFKHSRKHPLVRYFSKLL